MERESWLGGVDGLVVWVPFLLELFGLMTQRSPLSVLLLGHRLRLGALALQLVVFLVP